MALVTCPDCGKQISDQAPTCPSCGRPMRTPQPVVAPRPTSVAIQPKKTSGCGKVALILLAMVGGLVFLGFIVSQLDSPSGPAWKTDKQGNRYIAGPEITPAPVEDVKPVIQVRKILAARGDQIRAVLVRELGAGATVANDTSWGVMQWVGRKNGVIVEVLPDRGRVIDVVVEFKPPVRDWVAAFAMVGLDPKVTPTSALVAVVNWRGVIPGIDEVIGFFPDTGGPNIRQLTITPDKSASERFYQQK